MNKSAGAVLDLVLDRIKKYGPQAALVGGGVAGLSHLLAMKNQNDKEQAALNKDDNTIYLDIPKTAFDWNDAKDIGSAAAVGGLAGGAVGGATYLIANIIRKLRGGDTPPPQPVDQEDEGQYPEDKYASIFDTPSGSQYLLDSGLAVGTTLGAGALGYKVVDSILQNVRKRKEHEELEKTKGEYSKLLSQKIYGMETGKTASEVDFKNIEALAAFGYENADRLVNKTAFDKEALSDPTMASVLTSLPGVGALITGILAHNYWYNKQKDIEAGLAKQESEKMKKSPAMIKIRTVDPATGIEDKSAGFIDTIMSPELAAQQALSHELSGSNEEHTVVAPQKEKRPVFKESDVEDIDPNTVVVSTDDGDTQIDAEDAKSVKILQKYKDVIAKSIATGVNLNNGKDTEQE